MILPELTEDELAFFELWTDYSELKNKNRLMDEMSDKECEEYMQEVDADTQISSIENETYY